MEKDKLLTVREVAVSLGVTEQEVLDLAAKGLLKTSKVGSGYIRFRLGEVERLKKLGEFADTVMRYSFRDRLYDFLYFNDFYILACLIIAGLVYIIISQ